MQIKIALFFILCVSPLFGLEHVTLKTPNLKRENILGTNVGIRPHRKSGIRIEAETIKDKLILHNYGYGGSGLTLCLGGSKEIVDLLNAQNPQSKSVAILGAGVAGLATAYDLLKQGYEVHIYSDNWSPNLTSNVAAGIWSPLAMPENATAEQAERIQRMLDVSKERFLKSTGVDPEFAGVRLIDSYSFKASDSSAEAIKTKHHGEQVVVHFDNGVSKVGRKIREIGIEGQLFVEDLYSKVKGKAILTQRHFKNLEDVLSLDEPIVINCTSIGSRELFNDQELIPVRGQIIYFKPQKDMDFLIYQNVPGSTTTWVSIYPWGDRLILGGVYEKGEEDLSIDPKTIDMIINNAEKFLSGNM